MVKVYDLYKVKLKENKNKLPKSINLKGWENSDGKKKPAPPGPEWGEKNPPDELAGGAPKCPEPAP